MSSWSESEVAALGPVGPVGRWGLGDGFASYGIYLLVSLVVGIIAIAAVGGLGGDSVLGGPWLLVALIAPPVAQLAHVMWVGRTKGGGLRRDFGLSIRPSDIAVAGGLFIGAMIGATVAYVVAATVGIETPTAAVAEITEESKDAHGITIWLIMVAFVAATVVPLIEELVYRGLWWSALLKRGVSENWTLVITSAIFAVAHLEPTRTPVLFALGLGIGWGRKLTGRIGASIIAHAIINTLGMTALLTQFN